MPGDTAVLIRYVQSARTAIGRLPESIEGIRQYAGKNAHFDGAKARSGRSSAGEGFALAHDRFFSPRVGGREASILYGKDMDILIRNALILPMTASGKRSPEIFQGIGRHFRRPHIVGSSGDSGQRSDDRGTESENRSRRVIDAGGKLLMPGLINLHNHVAMSLSGTMPTICR